MGFLKPKKAGRKARRRLERGRPPPGKCYRCGRHVSGDACAHCWEEGEQDRPPEPETPEAE